VSHDVKTPEERKVLALESIAQSLKILSGEMLDLDSAAQSPALSLENMSRSLEVLVGDPDGKEGDYVGLAEIRGELKGLCDKLPKLDQKLEDLWTELRGIRTDTTP